MWGAIIGDIAGSRFEFANTFDYDFKLFTNECDFTDDTICTIAVADCILHGSDDYGSYIHKWCRKYPNPMGCYGGRFAEWIRSDSPKPYNSFGNGAAMRVSPIGFWFKNLCKLEEAAAKSAICSHNHEEGIRGACAVARAISFTQIGSNCDARKMAVDAIADRYYPGYKEREYIKGVFDETCQGTVPLCFMIIQASDSFEDAIRNAISFGGDSDTIGAIVGGIAEAVWGVPDSLKKKAEKYLPVEMLKVIREFYQKMND